jgi:hypothetical protein
MLSAATVNNSTISWTVAVVENMAEDLSDPLEILVEMDLVQKSMPVRIGDWMSIVEVSNDNLELMDKNCSGNFNLCK